jgi:hypothetical protein
MCFPHQQTSSDNKAIILWWVVGAVLLIGVICIAFGIAIYCKRELLNQSVTQSYKVPSSTTVRIELAHLEAVVLSDNEFKKQLQFKEQELNAILNLRQKEGVLEFPHTWSKQFDDGKKRDKEWWLAGRCEVAVVKGSHEWIEIEKRFKSTLPNDNLFGIKRVENRMLWNRYWTRRQEISLIAGDRPERSASRETVFFTLDWASNEAHMWHGTNSTDPQLILQHDTGLDYRFSAKGFYGHGLYVAEKSEYSDQYSFKNTDGAKRSIFLVRVALGEFRVYGSAQDNSLTKPPKNARTGRMYDSVQGGPHSGSMMYVVYDLQQVYPEYIVTYSKYKKTSTL